MTASLDRPPVDPRIAGLVQTLTRMRVFSLIGLCFGVLGVGVVLAGVYIWYETGVPIHDVHIYELAGDRVNAGGRVYDLRPDDPFPATEDRLLPLFGPPAVVIPWRLLVHLPGSFGVGIWLFAMTWSILATTFFVVLGTRGWAGLALIAALAWPVVVNIGVGNVDCAIASLLIVAWHLRGRPIVVGVIVGALIAVKLTPAAVLIWILATRRYRTLAWCAISFGAVFVATPFLLGDPYVWIRYVSVLTHLAVEGRTAALLVLVVSGAVVIAFGRGNDGVAFAVAILVMPAGSPQASIHSWSIVLVALAPIVEWLRKPRSAGDVPERSAWPGLRTLERRGVLSCHESGGNEPS